MNFFYFVIVTQYLTRILRDEYMYGVYVSFFLKLYLQKMK